MRQSYRKGYNTPQWAKEHPIRPMKYAVSVLTVLYETGKEQHPSDGLYHRWATIGTRTIARELGISRRRVQATLDALVSKRILARKVEQTGPNHTWITSYRLRGPDER